MTTRDKPPVFLSLFSPTVSMGSEFHGSWFPQMDFMPVKLKSRNSRLEGEPSYLRVDDSLVDSLELLSPDIYRRGIVHVEVLRNVLCGSLCIEAFD